MENKIEKKINLIENLKQIFEKKKKIFITLIISFIIIVIGVNFSGYNKKIKNEKITEKNIKAGIYLSSKDLKKSKKIYEEIVNSKNKFYSSLALNNIIENELEEDSEKILKLFKVIENIKGTKEQKDLIKLKKALFLIKINKENEGRKILEEIVSDNSIWKETAEDILQ